MQFKDIVSQFGRQIGVNLALDANGSCRLVFDRTLPVDIEVVESGVAYLHCAVGMLPTINAEATLRSLCEANLFGRGTGEAVLGVDGPLGEIILSRRLDLKHLDYAGFVSAVESFIPFAKAWTAKLDSRANAPAAKAPAPNSTGETVIRV